jgi:peptide deformylase
MLTLVTFPNAILKSKANNWQFKTEQDYADAAQVESEMIKLMQTSNGIGLAANQVGLLQRVFTIQLKDQTMLAMFNPRVISASEEQIEEEEGCLSFPDLWILVKRPTTIEAGYLDKHGKDCIITLTGIDARCFLHELDHLDGICFTDKVSPLKLAMARKKQLKKRKYNG